MIPKIIHLCWLSGDAFPSDIADCLKSWKYNLNDYEVWLWGKKPQDCLGLKFVEKHFDIDSVVWCKQAFEAKKYAFAADYIRLYALYNFGGIYLDSDVVVYKSFNELLHLPYFIGEDRNHCFEPAIVGCEQGTAWVGKVFECYVGREFLKPDSSYDMYGLPRVYADQLLNIFQFKKINNIPVKYEEKESVIYIFSYRYFNSRDYIGAVKTKDSFCSHKFIGSWLRSSREHKKRFKHFVPRPLLNVIYAMVFRFYYNKRLQQYMIRYS
jgi:hypothetical protein